MSPPAYSTDPSGLLVPTECARPLPVPEAGPYLRRALGVAWTNRLSTRANGALFTVGVSIVTAGNPAGWFVLLLAVPVLLLLPCWVELTPAQRLSRRRLCSLAVLGSATALLALVVAGWLMLAVVLTAMAVSASSVSDVR